MILLFDSTYISDAKVRLVTLELTVKLLIQLVTSQEDVLQEPHLAAVEAAKEHSTGLLRNFYKVNRFLHKKYCCFTNDKNVFTDVSFQITE